LMQMPEYTLTDDGKWILNDETFLFPDYILNDNGHWIINESIGN